MGAPAMGAPGMTIGPIQVIVFGFETTDKFRGEVVEELATLRGRGLIRLIDMMVAVKEEDGTITALELSDLTSDETAKFGQVLSKLLGVSDAAPEAQVSAVLDAAVDRTMAAASASLGLDYQGLHHAVENLQPGKAFGMLMFEHTWAIPLSAAIRRAGGVPLAQGFITPEVLVMVGEEVNAIADAANVIEVSETVKAAAILDTLATLREAEAVKTAIAADVVRTLAVAELIEEAAVAEAIDTLAAAGMLEAKYLDAAVETEAAEAAKMEAYFTAE
ncbi:MAG: hypothetical protein ACM30E_07880 [Nitrososphaerales archaeon]